MITSHPYDIVKRKLPLTEADRSTENDVMQSDWYINLGILISVQLQVTWLLILQELEFVCCDMIMNDSHELWFIFSWDGTNNNALHMLQLRFSLFRQVPDSQEVFINSASNQSIIVDILELVETPDPVEAAK